jgi:hypothetical protein
MIKEKKATSISGMKRYRKNNSKTSRLLLNKQICVLATIEWESAEEKVMARNAQRQNIYAAVRRQT